MAAKVIIDQQYPRDFTGACAYFSQQVAQIHGPAQLEYQQAKNKKCGIYAVDSVPVVAAGREAVLAIAVDEVAVVTQEGVDVPK